MSDEKMEAILTNSTCGQMSPRRASSQACSTIATTSTRPAPDPTEWGASTPEDRYLRNADLTVPNHLDGTAHLNRYCLSNKERLSLTVTPSSSFAGPADNRPSPESPA